MVSRRRSTRSARCTASRASGSGRSRARRCRSSATRHGLKSCGTTSTDGLAYPSGGVRGPGGGCAGKGSVMGRVTRRRRHGRGARRDRQGVRRHARADPADREQDDVEAPPPVTVSSPAGLPRLMAWRIRQAGYADLEAAARAKALSWGESLGGVVTDEALDEIGKVYGVTRERIRQIESKTMSKLRHPSRSQVLRD